MAQAYETMVIVHPETADEEIRGLVDTLTESITQAQGECLKVERWGHRRLAYKIKGLLKGYFLLLYYYGNPQILQTIDSLLRYKEYVLRYQTVKLDKRVDPESIRKPEPSGETAEAEAVTAAAPETEKVIAAEDTGVLEETKGEAPL